MFIMSLAVADLTVGLIVMPISSAYALANEWQMGDFICLFWLSADYTASTASILNLLILSLDRCVIFCSFHGYFVCPIQVCPLILLFSY